MADVQEAKGIKLFGTTISLQTQKPKKETIADQDSTKSSTDNESQEKRPDKIVPCPRCKSMETKFCYFNNYNVNQPRHFCKGCQRYWTAGGALRNVPVGAGRRKTKPSFQSSGEFPGNYFFEASCDAQRFDFDAVVQEWQLAAVHSGFEYVFPAKRRRSISGGQSC